MLVSGKKLVDGRNSVTASEPINNHIRLIIVRNMSRIPDLIRLTSDSTVERNLKKTQRQPAIPALGHPQPATLWYFARLLCVSDCPVSFIPGLNEEKP
ncbi:MAG: hypothetical protein COW58_03440 [Thalassolituus sp. CG17_big_fil_post_rev_8_21_14_2_50_53_8]|nr:MAG: hypothetical protein COW58_03440 [Thalassolituus sp. CG17_big_fil_post_rev_8_21_14_2_50_53_8]